MLCILLADFRKALYPEPPSAKAMARKLKETKIFPDFKIDELERVVNEMDTCGHRYLNLEKKLGAGVCFALGGGLSESHWTKLLPAGTKADPVIRHLKKNTRLTEIASALAPLRQRVIDVKRFHLVLLDHPPPPVTEAALPSVIGQAISEQAQQQIPAKAADQESTRRSGRGKRKASRG